ncbi:MAG: hypothetical protein FWC01_01520 [Treponema sp.]|nr:hypothetical protein [Treponema sp.]MCL2236885.1 hypothetical protein [Treponema sp.]
MKRMVIFILIASLTAGMVFAQAVREQQAADSNNPERGNRREGMNRPEQTNRQRTDNTVTVEGTLQLQRGMVAVASGDTVYPVPMLTRYIGFINGLTEGTRVTVVGVRNNDRNSIRPVNVTIAGRTYDFDAPAQRQSIGNQNKFGRRHDNDRQRPQQQNNNRSGRNSQSRGNCCCR